MLISEKITAKGSSGRLYEFRIYTLGTEFKRLAGVYLFSHQLSNGNWFVAYVGSAEDFDARVGAGLSSHHKIREAKKLGATHVGVLVVSGPKADRLAIERDLIDALKPPLNEISPPRR